MFLAGEIQTDHLARLGTFLQCACVTFVLVSARKICTNAQIAADDFGVGLREIRGTNIRKLCPSHKIVVIPMLECQQMLSATCFEILTLPFR